jgi:hypothetical protein
MIRFTARPKPDKSTKPVSTGATRQPVKRKKKTRRKANG